MFEEFYKLYDFVLFSYVLNTYTNVSYYYILVQFTLNLQALEMKDDDLFIYSIE